MWFVAFDCVVFGTCVLVNVPGDGMEEKFDASVLYAWRPDPIEAL